MRNKVLLTALLTLLLTSCVSVEKEKKGEVVKDNSILQNQKIEYEKLNLENQRLKLEIEKIKIQLEEFEDSKFDDFKKNN